MVDNSGGGEIVAIADPTSTFLSLGVHLGGTAEVVNTGTIAGEIGILIQSNQALFSTIQNQGDIYGGIIFDETSDGIAKLWVTNSGQIHGDVLMDEVGTGEDKVVNSGLIDGAVALGAGNDTYDGRGGIVRFGVFGEKGNDRLTGGTRGDLLDGGDGDDILQGGAGDDRLAGGNGNDFLFAGTGSDRLEGGAGVDLFIFTAPADSRDYALRSDGAKIMPDMIADFAKGVDKIDLRGIDAIAGTAADDAFIFIGAGSFSHHAGELRCSFDRGIASIFGDVDGDGLADLTILAVTPAAFSATDFIL